MLIIVWILFEYFIDLAQNEHLFICAKWKICFCLQTRVIWCALAIVMNIYFAKVLSNFFKSIVKRSLRW